MNDEQYTYVVMEEWMKIEPCLPYLVGSERLVISIMVFTPVSLSHITHIIFMIAIRV